MIKNIKQFIKYLRRDISKSFLYSQASFDYILKDKIYAFFKCKDDRFFIIKGNDNNVEFENEKKMIIDSFEKNKVNTSVSERGLGFSKSMLLEDVPDIFLRIIKKHQEEIKKYLGEEILFEKPLFFRNYNIDSKFSSFDVYSNIWHQDSHDGNRLLKIFILTDNVSEDDGPFHWLNEDQTRANWEKLRDRWTFDVFSKVQKIPGENILIGDVGSYLILDTSRCMHKAGIPKKYRNMLQLTLYPQWRERKGRYEKRI